MDTTDRNSLTTASNIYKQLEDLTDKNAVKILVTNKADVIERKFSVVEGSRLAKEL